MLINISYNLHQNTIKAQLILSITILKLSERGKKSLAIVKKIHDCSK